MQKKNAFTVKTELLNVANKLCTFDCLHQKGLKLRDSCKLEQATCPQKAKPKRHQTQLGFMQLYSLLAILSIAIYLRRSDAYSFYSYQNRISSRTSRPSKSPTQNPTKYPVTFEETLKQNHLECTPYDMKEAVLVPENLVYNNLGGFKSKYCGDASTNICNGESCCAETGMVFRDIFPDWTERPAIDLIITNTTTYIPRTEVSSPPNGFTVSTSDVPQINLATTNSVTLNYSFRDSLTDSLTKLDYFDFTIYDIDSGEENALETVTLCNPGIHSVYLLENSSVAVKFDEADQCVIFSSTTKGFEENNPKSSTDAMLIVKQLAVTVRFSSVSSFSLTYRIENGPVGQGRNFLFSGKSFQTPLKCPVDPEIPEICKPYFEKYECDIEPSSLTLPPSTSPTNSNDGADQDWWSCRKKRDFRKSRGGKRRKY